MDSFVIIDGRLQEYNGPGGDVVIPDGVKTIGPFAFSECGDVWAEDRDWIITSVVIPDSVKRIENYAFTGLDDLVSVTVPASVVYFGEGVFEDCTALTLRIAPGSAAEGYARWHAIPYELTE